MPIGTPFHARTFALSESLAYRDWAGYYAASAYEAHHDHEYAAIRNAAALIDISPLFKYIVSGRHAARLVNRVITRDVDPMVVGQVFYTPWCDEAGAVIDDGTVTRLAEQRFRWTAAEPMLRWLHLNGIGMDVSIEDVSETIAALAVQGPRSAAVLRAAAEADIDGLRYFRATSGRIAGVPVDISRTGYTGDLGYELWMPAERAVPVWDALMLAGRPFGLKPAGMLALDVARVEAGLLLAAVDYVGSRRALTASQTYTPFELGLGRLVADAKAPFVGSQALAVERARGPARLVVGLEIDWPSVEAVYERAGIAPVMPAAASRAAVPVYRGRRQVGRATTTAWSPLLKRLVALATVEAGLSAAGTKLEFELTVEAVRHRVGATVVRTPFLALARKAATPPD